MFNGISIRCIISLPHDGLMGTLIPEKHCLSTSTCPSVRQCLGLLRSHSCNLNIFFLSSLRVNPYYFQFWPFLQRTFWHIQRVTEKKPHTWMGWCIPSLLLNMIFPLIEKCIRSLCLATPGPWNQNIPEQLKCPCQCEACTFMSESFSLLLLQRHVLWSSKEHFNHHGEEIKRDRLEWYPQRSKESCMWMNHTTNSFISSLTLKKSVEIGRLTCLLVFKCMSNVSAPAHQWGCCMRLL